MIEFKQAKKHVLDHHRDFGEVRLPLEKAMGRILAEAIYADRDFPPFDRATKDGIAINYDALEAGNTAFSIMDVAAAGSSQKRLINATGCIEVMTGAMLPADTDTVIMYEHLTIAKGMATPTKAVKRGQNIHYKGSDKSKGSLLLEVGTKIGPPEIGILATVGKHELRVKKNPRICLVATGDELVEVSETPEPYQIRKSNMHTLKAALLQRGLSSTLVHLTDDETATRKAISELCSSHEVLLLSGGVSKGKFDYLPKVFDFLGVEKVFHRVAQRPGKPFWFGVHKDYGTTIFAFPGNPVSTFVNYHIYFGSWLNQCFGLPTTEINVILGQSVVNNTDLTRFLGVKVSAESGKLLAQVIHENGSGDLASLSKTNGVIQLKPNTQYDEGQQVLFIPTGSLFG